jgi:hypothetical protein
MVDHSPAAFTTRILKNCSSPFSQPDIHLLLDNSPLFYSSDKLDHVQCPAHSLLYTRLPKTTNQYTNTLMMATAMSVETLDNSQHSTPCKP